MTVGEMLILAGPCLTLVMAYVGWVHHRTSKLEDQIDRNREMINQARNEMARQYVDREMGDKLFNAVDEIKRLIGKLSARIDVLFDRQEHDAR